MPFWMKWVEDESSVAVTIISIALMLAAGFLMTRVTKKLRLPNVTAYIVGGILAGPFWISRWPSSPSAQGNSSGFPPCGKTAGRSSPSR